MAFDHLYKWADLERWKALHVTWFVPDPHVSGQGLQWSQDMVRAHEGMTGQLEAVSRLEVPPRGPLHMGSVAKVRPAIHYID